MSSPPPELRKHLGFTQIALYGLGSMLGAGIYALIGRAAETLGSAVWLAFAVAMVAALLTGLSYASVGSRYAKAGGAAYVTQRGFNRGWLSYMVGFAVMMSGLTSMATGSQAIADNLIKAFAWTLPGKAVAILLVLAIGLLIFRGIRECMWANILCTVVETSGLLFIIAVGCRYWGRANLLEFPPEATGGSVAVALIVLQGAVLTFFSFIGFEDVLNVSEEARDARRDVPRGLVVAMLAATLIYMAVAITAVSVVPWRELAASKTPLMDVARTAAPWLPGIDGIYLGITIFAIGNTALLNYLMGSRLLYGMSRQGLLPGFLGTLHPRRQTPGAAIVTLFVIVTALILIGGVKALAEATVLLLLAVFVVVNLSLLRLQRRPDEPKGGFEVPAAVPLLGALTCLALIVVRLHAAITSTDATKSTAPFIAGGILVASVGLYQVLRPRNAVGTE